MATMYRQDITQNIEPAMADVSTLAKADQAMAAAAESSAKATSTLLQAAGAAYETYRDYDIKNTRDDQGLTADQLTQEFFMSNQAASAAAEQAGTLAAKKSAYAQRAEDIMFDINTPDWKKVEQQAQQTLSGFDSELQRLKLASQGGMSKEQYVTRVSALTRNAIAKYPGMADKIREQVGKVTGLEGADRWAQMQFVKSMFTKDSDKKGPTELDFVKQDIDAASKTGIATQEELWNMYNTDRAGYVSKMTSLKQLQMNQTNTAAVKTQVEGLNVVSDSQADNARAGFTAIFSGSLATSVLSESITQKENVWSQTAQLMAEGIGPNTDPVKFKVQIDMHNVSMRTNIEKARQTALASLDNFFANNPNISDKKRNEMRGDINNSADTALRLYADDKGVGLGAMAAIMSNYRDKSIKEQSDLIDLAIKQQTAMQNNPLVTQYWNGGSQRENLKRQYPDFHAFMETQERVLTTTIGNISSMIDSAKSLSVVENVVNQAGNTGAAVPTSPEQDVVATKAAHQALWAQASSFVDKADKNNVLTDQEVNVVSAAIATSIDNGANARILAKDYKKLQGKLAKMDGAELNTIKDNASNATITTVAKIQGIKRNVEAKYGVTINVGVNSAGQISGVIPDMGARPLAQGAQPIAPAIKEFNNLIAPMAMNIVYGRAMLTNEEPVAVGTDFANIINSGGQYQGFFSLKPQPVAGAGRGVVNPTTVTTDETTTTTAPVTSKPDAWWRQ
jgi:hypothetical protein